MSSPRSRDSHRHPRDVKDRLIQTRVPERLESVLKEEAHKRRLTVSHLIRNMLEDTLNLVDTVVHGAGDIVGESVDLAEQVARDATKIATAAREAVRARAATSSAEPAGAPPPRATPPVEPRSAPRTTNDGEQEDEQTRRLSTLEHVLAWNQVVVHRPALCAGCHAELPRGSVAHLGLSQDPAAPPAWLCPRCLERL
jgi:hypothetical protein